MTGFKIGDDRFLTGNGGSLVYDATLKQFKSGEAGSEKTIAKADGLTCGVYVEPTITDNGDTTLTIGSGQYTFKTTLDETGTYVIKTIAGNTFTPSDGITTYIVAQYNSGSPIISAITNRDLIDCIQTVIICTVDRNGSELNIVCWDSVSVNKADKIFHHMASTKRFEYELTREPVLSESATRVVNISGFKIWYSGISSVISSCKSDVDHMHFHYRVSGVWNNTVVTQYPNTQYDDGNLQTLGTGRVGLIWVFRAISETSKHIHIVLGNADYKTTEWQAATLLSNADLPPVIVRQCKLVGRIAVIKSNNTALSIQQVSTTDMLQAPASSPNFLTNRLIVGANSYYTTIKSAVDWFNSSATANTEILIDGGLHLIADTITVNNATYKLQIRGLGPAITKLNASTGLTGKPMFDFKTPCDVNKVWCDATTLASYGTAANENCINYTTNAENYSELTDLRITGFKIGVGDLIGSDIFVFNYIIEDCGIGAQVNYSTAAVVSRLDMEIGNVERCPIGVDLLKATAGNFILDQNIFVNENSTDTAIKYTGGTGNFVLFDSGNGLQNITSNSYNNIGSVLSGFDFTNVRDANIEVIGNIGVEDKTPHLKINVVNNASGTSLTSTTTYFKAVFTNTSQYTSKFGINNNKITYLSDHKRDVMMWINGNIQANENNRDVNIAIRRNLNISSVTGNGATVTVVCSSEHGLLAGTQVQMLGWSGGTGTWNGLYSITIVDDEIFTYASTGNGTATGGSSGAILSPFTARITTSGQPYTFGLSIYAEDVVASDYFEIYLNCSNDSSVTATLQDLTWMVDSR